MVTNIYTIGRPSDPQRLAFKKAKEALRIEDGLVFARAVPGCGKVIIFGSEAEADETPDFLCEWITLFHHDDRDVEQVLAWYLLDAFDWRIGTWELWLERALGRGGVAEVSTLV